MNKRLEQFLAAENISQAEFADKIGVARASVSHVLAGRNKPGYDFIESMARHYPALNIDWIITGRGKMYLLPGQNSGQTSEAPQRNGAQQLGEAVLGDGAQQYDGARQGNGFPDPYESKVQLENQDSFDLFGAENFESIAQTEVKPTTAPQPSRPQNDYINVAPATGRQMQNGNAVQIQQQSTNATSVTGQQTNNANAAPGWQMQNGRTITKVIAFYSDGTFSEL